MKKYIIILMFAVMTPATQSCLPALNVIDAVLRELRYGNTIYYYNNQSSSISFCYNNLNRWNNWHNIYVPVYQNYWSDPIHLPIRNGYSYSSGTYRYDYLSNRCYLNINCINNLSGVIQQFQYCFGWNRQNELQWY
jgi:hypothetical protein